MSLLTHQLYRAGAGAGKTTKLITLIQENALAFKELNGRFPNFIVTTFTRKATQELKERLMVSALKRKDPEYLEFVSSSHHVMISTIHGVLSTFLSRHGHSFSFDPSLSILTFEQERKLELKIVKDLFSEAGIEELMDTFGLARIVSMLHTAAIGIDQFGELQSFTCDELKTLMKIQTEKIAVRAQKLSEQLKGENSNAAWMSHAQKLTQASLAVTSLDFDQARSILKDARKPSFTDKAKVSALSNAEAEDIKEAIQQILKQPGYSQSLWESHIALTERFLNIARLFHQRLVSAKRRQGVLSMSDLELRTLQELRKNPEPATAFGNEWDYWFIDEYQDTSPVQEELIQRLQSGKPEFVVGDPQQSIYLFRGSRSEVFHRKEKLFIDKNYSRKVLDENYRSRASLVEFFNEYFKSKKFQPMISKKDWSSDIKPVTFFKANTTDAQFEGIISWVQNLLARGVRAEEICVLAKKNEVLKQISELMRKYAIPHRLHISGGFGFRREVQDALCLLKFLVNPHDHFNLLCLLRSPFFKLEDEIIESYCSQNNSLWLQISRSDLGVAKNLLRIREWTQERGIAEAFYEALYECGYFDAANASDESGVKESNLFKLLNSLKEAQRRPDFNFLNFIAQISEDNVEASESDAIPAVEPRRVNLMTIHRSKGLQFGHVLVPEFQKGMRPPPWNPVIIDEETNKLVLSIPNEDSKNDSIFVSKEITDGFSQREREESTRLLYVAFTRAKESIFVSMSQEVEKFSWLESCPLDLSEGTNNDLYQVLTELPPLLLEIKNKKEEEKIGPIATKLRPKAQQYSVTKIIESKSKRNFKNVLGAVDRIRTGTELHNIFEVLAKNYSEEKESELLARVPQKYQKAVHYLFEQTEVPMREILKNAFAEYGFISKRGDTRLEGKIDLWAQANGKLWIVDYKTGSPDHKAKAFEQLRFYAEALTQLTGSKTAELVVIFPFDEQIYIEGYCI